MTVLESLSGSARFQAAQRSGRRTSIPGISVAVRPAEQGMRVGLAVRASGAVERNRVKRRLRAAIREAWADAPISAEIVVRADERGASIPFQELVALLTRSLEVGRVA